MNRLILKSIYDNLRPVISPKLNRKFVAPIYDSLPKTFPVLSVSDLKFSNFTNSGMIGLKIAQNQAVMVEISSAENKGDVSIRPMLEFLERILDSCHLLLERRRYLDNYLQILMKQDKLNGLEDKDGLLMALHTKGIIVPKKAILLNSLMSIQFYGLTAGSMQTDELTDLSFRFGKCGVLLAYRKLVDNSMNDRELEIILKNICEHVLVMDPVTIDQQKTKNVARNRCLLQQSYLFDENLSVAKFAALNQIQLIDFKRFECDNDSNDANIITPGLHNCPQQFYSTLL